MERPSWAPVILLGAIPREPTDLLAIIIIGIVALESTLTKETILGLGLGTLILFSVISFTSALASLSNTTRKLREELALFAYGGSTWHIWVRYFLRGVTCSLLAISPLLVARLVDPGPPTLSANLSFAVLLVAGGSFYAIPSLLRIRSRDFVENYKG